MADAHPCLAFLRGVNVGGANRLKMADLAAWLRAAGMDGVQTYIQSGNLVFVTRDVTGAAVRIGDTIEERAGFRPLVMVMSAAEFAALVAACPFADAGDADPKSVHLFLAEVPLIPDLDRIDALQSGRERWVVDGRAFWLHAPDGIGRSKLAAGVERALGLPVTARNWRTVTAMLDLADKVRAGSGPC